MTNIVTCFSRFLDRSTQIFKNHRCIPLCIIFQLWLNWQQGCICIYPRSAWFCGKQCGMFGPISQFGPLEFLSPLLPKHPFSSSLSHNMKAMYSTVQFYRQNILNDQQIPQKHTFNRPFSARYNNTKWMGFHGVYCIALHCATELGAAPRWTLYENSLSDLLFSLFFLIFWDVNIMGLGYSWWNMHLQIY